MHNLKANIEKFYGLAQTAFDSELNGFHNFRHYPNLPKCADLLILAIAVTAECLALDSENHLYRVLGDEYPELLCLMPDRSNYNRRKRRLRDYIDRLSAAFADSLAMDSNTYIIDSIPVPVCRYARFPQLKIMQEQPDFKPTAGYLHIDNRYFGGYKLHALVTDTGVIMDYRITQGKVHDIKALTPLSHSIPDDSDILADKGYLSNPIQLDLFENREIRVYTPLRKNQRAESDWTKKMGRQRKRVETLFSQLCDQFMLKRNYAKSVAGFLTRISAKIAAVTCLQFLNKLADRNINLLKSALTVPNF